MKKLLLALALLFPAAAFGQGSGSVANHAVVLGRGPGVTGFGAVVPSTAGQALTSNGAGVDPSFQSLTLAPGAVTNSLLASMAANTLKANITAGVASPTDVAIPQCDGTGQWLDYTPVTGFTCVSLTATAGALVVNGQLTVNGAIIDTSGNATLKSVLIPGSTSGTVTQSAQAVAGTPIVTWGTATGTPAVTASAPLSITAATGNITCALCTTSSGGGALSATAPITLTGNVIALTTPLSLTNGGTNASLTASAGGIVWSTGSAFSVLSGTATASQVLLSGASVTPAWSTATYPGTAAAGTVLGAASANVVAATATPTLGAVGTQGQLKLSGTTSGTVTQTTAAAAGSPTVTWGSATGTPAVTATGPLAITAATGNITCATCATTTNGGALTGTAPAAISAAGAISVQGATGQVLTGSGGTGSAFSATPTLGAVGTQGTLALAGTTSGTVTQTTAAAAGTPTVTWGSGTGTPAVTATGPLAITAATGNITCSTCATTTNGGALTATAPVAISVGGVISLTNPLPVANGGTNGTSASGTLLDNITAFASTGFINRTGAGTYTFSTASGILDGIGSTQGNVLFRGAASWTALATGTAGQVLTTQGAGANPTWTTVTGTGTVTNVATGVGLSGGPITTTGTIVMATNPECGRLSLASTTSVAFTPLGCELIRINGVVFSTTGLAGCTNTAAFVNGTGASSLAASTFYYVYAFSNAGTPTCDFRTDGNGHIASTAAGNLGTEVRISSGTTQDQTRTLVGAVVTNGSSQFQDSSTCLCVASWMHPGRRDKSGQSALTASVNLAIISGTTPFLSELSSTLRTTFIVWNDESLSYHANMVCFPGSAVNNDVRVVPDFDGSGTLEDAIAVGQAWGTTQDTIPISLSIDKTGLAEGQSHYATVFAGANSVTGTPQCVGAAAAVAAVRSTQWIRTRQ